MTSPGNAKVENVSAGRVDLSIRDGFKRELMTFSVESTQPAGGHLDVTVRIDSLSTLQSTVLFVPVGPKFMNGSKAYRAFLDEFEQRILARDSSAQVRRVVAD